MRTVFVKMTPVSNSNLEVFESLNNPKQAFQNCAIVLVFNLNENYIYTDSEMKLPVYNCSSYGFKRISQSEFTDLALKISKEVPFNDMMWAVGGRVTKCKFMYYLRVFFFHLIPAILVDSILRLTNREPRLIKLYRKIFVANNAVGYFLTQEWSFINKKILALDECILERDREAFSFNIGNINFEEFITRGAYGIREYLLKEDNLCLPEARAHARKMNLLDKVLKASFFLMMVYMGYKFGIFESIKVFMIEIFTELYMLF